MTDNRILLVFLCLFLEGCYTTLKEDSFLSGELSGERYTPQFENFYRKVIFLPDDCILFQEDIRCTDSIFDRRYEKEIITRRQTSGKITGELYDFLCNADLINGWCHFKYHQDFDVTRTECATMEKNFSEYYYLGRVYLSRNFNSYVILCRTLLEDDRKYYSNHRRLYLINAIDRKVSSITQIGVYGDVEVWSYDVSEWLKGCVFIHTSANIAGDEIFEEDETEQPKVLRQKFKFDEQGYLHQHKRYKELDFNKYPI